MVSLIQYWLLCDFLFVLVFSARLNSSQVGPLSYSSLVYLRRHFEKQGTFKIYLNDCVWVGVGGRMLNDSQSQESHTTKNCPVT